MSNGNSYQASGDPTRDVGQAISDISEKITLLVHEEIALAKAEIETTVKRLIRGAVVGLAAGFFALLAVITLVNSGAWGLAEIFNDTPWLGFLVTAGALFVFAAVAGLIAARNFKDSSPVPEMAIEEARKTKELIGSGS